MTYGYESLTLIPATGSPLTVDVASQDLYRRTDDVSVRGDGSEGLDARTHTLEALVVDAAALGTLEKWERAGTLVLAFARGLEASLAWDEPSRVRVLSEPPQKAGRHRAKVRLFSALRDAAVEGPRVNLVSGRFAPVEMPWGSAYQSGEAAYAVRSEPVPVGAPGTLVTAALDVLALRGRQDGQVRLWLEWVSWSGALLGRTGHDLWAEYEGARLGVQAITADVPVGVPRVRWCVESTSTSVGEGSDVFQSACLRVGTSVMATPATQPVGY